MAADWISKRHDTRRVLETTLGPQGLLTAWLAQALADAKAGTDLAKLACIVKAAAQDGKTPIDGAAKVNKPAEVLEATTGSIRYVPVAEDVTTSGTYLVEWEVTDAQGKVDTYPTDGYDVWQIVDDLDNAP